MTNFYIIIVVVLFALAISDLIVGVSNDAVNFLNSALGSKAAPRYIIMIIASIGIIVGTTFSEGMMEVARKGIFHPDHFNFSEIMIIFLAVMLTDIILLDTFNTLGLPTSTTVSIVFELLGAAVAVAIVKVFSTPGQTLANVHEYINTAKALAIISGILLSVVVAFACGAIIQYITRIIFSFNYSKSYKYFGSLWGGIAITAITFFILIKGAKGSSFLSKDNMQWITDNSLTIIFASFVGWTVLLQILVWVSKINILKLITLVGTFALAMAFAGNDLVNFIGVPLAGFESFKTFLNSGSSPDALAMTSLTGKIQTPTMYLIIAGLIMVITLWLSRKARTVTQTEINLSRQDIGDERFNSTMFSRLLVRKAIGFGNTMGKITPKPIMGFLEKRFDATKLEKRKGEEKGAFDLVRASVNLTVASILISIATSLKLPLSTTYVTFMVAMGTSLTDRAWGRESAVYRITGVITVIGGWFMTALIAFTVALLIAFIISLGGKIAIAALLILAVFFVYRTHIAHRKKEEEKQEDVEFYTEPGEGSQVVDSCTKRVSLVMLSIKETYSKNIHAILSEDRKSLKKLYKDNDKINKKTKKIKNKVYDTLELLQQVSSESGLYYIQVTDYLRELSHSLTHIIQPCFEHFENQHKGFNEEISNELNKLDKGIDKLLTVIIDTVENLDLKNVEKAISIQQSAIKLIDTFRKTQVKRIKKKDAGTKVSILYLNLLNETKNISLQAVNLLKAHRDFIQASEIGEKNVVLDLERQ